MNKFVIKEILLSENGYKIRWDLGRYPDYIRNHDIEVSYDFQVSDDLYYPVNIAFALLLPALAIDSDEISIETPFPLPDYVVDYWRYELKELHRREIKLIAESTNTSEQRVVGMGERPDKASRIGLFFGGGVESMYALSRFYLHRPVLLSIVGENWMNNKEGEYSIKQQLEDQLIADYQLDIQRIRTNLRLIYDTRDSFVNKWSTGFLFYFLSLPVASEFNINMFFKSHELEAALNFTDYDLSMHPRFKPRIQVPHKNYPLMTPVFTGHAKVHMFDELTKTDFIKYIYSCLNNTDKRWCGACGKCYRISEYSETIGFDKSIIGMQEGIKGKRERSPIARNHWLLLDLFRGKKKSLASKLLRR